MINYENSLYRQLEETIEENDKLKITVKELRRENAELKCENRYLRNKIAEIEETLEERIKKAVNAVIMVAVEPVMRRDRAERYGDKSIEGDNR